MTQLAPLALALMVCLPAGAAEQSPATPPRIGNRVIAPISRMAKTPRDEVARLELISAAHRARLDLEVKYPPPLGLARRVPDGSILIDGRLEDAAWKTAPWIAGFRETRSGQPEKDRTRVRLAWDATWFYVAFECDDAVVAATIEDRDGAIWTQDAVEVFIDANGDGMSYLELELSPAGVQLDVAVADYRPEVNWITDFGHLDLWKALKAYDAKDLRTAVVVHGTLNQNDDVDQGWSAEIAISWDDIARGTGVARVPPVDGDTWRIGLFRINIDTDSDKGAYAAWNPSTSWFHVPWAFGHVLFAE